MMLLNGNENAGRVEARGAAGARERRGSARETFAGPRRRVPLILGRTSSTNRILAEAYSTPTTNPRMRITRDIPRHHIAVDTERCSVVVRARTGAAAASRDTGPAPDRRCGSRDAIAEHSAHRERLSRVSPREKPRLGKSTRNRDDPPVRQILPNARTFRVLVRLLGDARRRSRARPRAGRNRTKCRPSSHALSRKRVYLTV